MYKYMTSLTSTSTPLHGSTCPDTVWTRGNLGEALPGLFTPLGWTITSDAIELGIRRAFRAIGVLKGAEVVLPPAPDQRVCGIFHGHIAANLTTLRSFVDGMPGASANQFEQSIVG